MGSRGFGSGESVYRVYICICLHWNSTQCIVYVEDYRDDFYSFTGYEYKPT